MLHLIYSLKYLESPPQKKVSKIPTYFARQGDTYVNKNRYDLCSCTADSLAGETIRKKIQISFPIVINTMKETNGYSVQECENEEGGPLEKAFKPRLEGHSWTKEQNI